MKKQFLFMFMLLFSSYALLLSACSHSEEEKIQVYLEKNSEAFYHFLVVDYTDGILNIEFKMLANSETWSNEAVESDLNIETKAILETVKKYSEGHLDAVKEVNIYFVTRESNKTVAEIYANNDTLLETNWLELDRNELSHIVDGYKFYGVSN